MVFAGLVLISLIAISAISMSATNQLGSSTKKLATEGLNDQAIRNMQASADQNARIVQQKFAVAETSINKIAKVVEELMDPDTQVGERKSYLDTETETALPNRYLDPEYGETISNTTSTYYYPNSYLVNGKLTNDMNDTIRRSAWLDETFSAIWSQNRDFVWLYVAFANGVFRNFPGAHVDDKKEYDPPAENWYVQALNAFGKITYVSPYFDITQGLVISLTKAVYVKGNLVGVVGLDFKTQTVRDKIVNVHFMKTGYASLFSASDLSVISHPDFDGSEEGVLITDLEKNGGSSWLTPGTLNEMTSGSNGTIQFTKTINGTPIDYLGVYSPVKSDNGDVTYVLLIVVQLEEVLAPINEVQKALDTLQSQTLKSLIGLGLLLLIVSLGVGLMVATAITSPIQKLIKLAQTVTRNITKDDPFEDINLKELETSDDELGELAKSFTTMIRTLKEDQKKKPRGLN